MKVCSFSTYILMFFFFSGRRVCFRLHSNTKTRSSVLDRRPTAARAPPHPPHPMRKCPPRRPPYAPAPATPRQFKDRDTPKIGEGGPARTEGIDVSIRTVSGCASFITCQTPPVMRRRNSSTWRKLASRFCARDASRPMRRSRRSATSSSSHCRAHPRPASRACRPQPAPPKPLIMDTPRA